VESEIDEKQAKNGKYGRILSQFWDKS